MQPDFPGPTLYETLDREFPDDLAYVETYYSYLMDYVFINGESYPQINKAVLYTDNDTILHSGSVYRIDEQVRSEDWFQLVMEDPKKKPRALWPNPAKAQQHHGHPFIRCPRP